jgi:5-formyltetrahydrofolate cyclo-ligase
VRIESLSELVVGTYGVPEPLGEPAPIEEIDLFLVPGVAFDRQGNRLGFGGGYYDRALEEVRKLNDINGLRGLSEGRDRIKQNGASAPLLIGICYQWQLVDGQLPVESHDISVDVIATDEELIYCSDGRMT